MRLSLLVPAAFIAIPAFSLPFPDRDDSGDLVARGHGFSKPWRRDNDKLDPSPRPGGPLSAPQGYNLAVEENKHFQQPASKIAHHTGPNIITDPNRSQATHSPQGGTLSPEQYRPSWDSLPSHDFTRPRHMRSEAVHIRNHARPGPVFIPPQGSPQRRNTQGSEGSTPSPTSEYEFSSTSSTSSPVRKDSEPPHGFSAQTHSGGTHGSGGNPARYDHIYHPRAMRLHPSTRTNGWEDIERMMNSWEVEYI